MLASPIPRVGPIDVSGRIELRWACHCGGFPGGPEGRHRADVLPCSSATGHTNSAVWGPPDPVISIFEPSPITGYRFIPTWGWSFGLYFGSVAQANFEA